MTMPIACTLTPGEYTDRLTWIEELNRTALRSHARDGRTLVLTYAPEAAARVRALAEQESRCCAFLAFRVDEQPDAVRLTVRAPAETADAAESLFAPLLAGSDVGVRRLPSVAASTAAVAAVACGVCCVVPLALPAVATTAAGSLIAAFAHGYRWALRASLVLTAAGWAWVAWRGLRTRRRPARSTVRAMSMATLLTAVALSWPLLEPLLY